jgi:hypothetical protein
LKRKVHQQTLEVVPHNPLQIIKYLINTANKPLKLGGNE